MLDAIKNKKFHFYTNLDLKDTLTPIATDELFVRTPLGEDECIFHLYTLQNSAIIGSPDTRVPHFKEALSVFYDNDVNPAVRNIGGLGIISDKGVINISIIMKNPREDFSINEGYDLMTDFIKEVFPEGSDVIEAYEITHSYCPGDYDLSINGKKFAGIGQRKVKDNVVISAYISIFGDQERRANLIRQFYDKGIQDEVVNYKYPVVEASAMATLEELLNVELSVEEALRRIYNVLMLLDCTIVDGHFTPKMQEDYQKLYAQTTERTNRFLGK